MAIAKITLRREYFKESRHTIYEQGNMKVVMFRYPSDVEALEITNAHGRMVVLPYMGQMIWDLEMDGIDLKMKNMFSHPKKTNVITDTYGCFAFHSGLLANGCPAAEDDHALHGEMPCAEMDQAWLEVSDSGVKVCGTAEYVKGFGHHYEASPSVTLPTDESFIDIQMKVRNLAKTPMPLQYMCHMNYAYMENARLTANIPDDSFTLRESVPAHVTPTDEWLAYTNQLAEGQVTFNQLNDSKQYDPEIVFFADQLSQYTETADFRMNTTSGTFFTTFCTSEFNYATRWILYNEDQQVGAFVLPATSRPEGYLAAKRAGSLIELAAGEEKTYSVKTGLMKEKN